MERLEKERRLQELAAAEASLLEKVSERKALVSVAERAKGVVYTEPLKTDWRPPRYLLDRGEAWANELRRKWHIDVEGDGVPPPCKTFQDMKLPPAVIEALKANKITKPTPIQVQGIPVILTGRDMIGVAYTGSGKTLVFVLPVLLTALSEELRLPLVEGEGPVALCIAPSRELARQTFEVLEKYAEGVVQQGLPRIRTMLAMGGIPMAEQLQALSRGVHVVVATPGRLCDLLNSKKMNLKLCRYLCLDEADHLIDLGFEDDVRTVFDHFDHQRQTVMFSATMPVKIQAFARSAMVAPVVVNVGRAGAANLDVIQEVEYVKQEAKLVYLLECLQKSGPRVIIFCESKVDVDDIHEYLLLKGVDAVSIHAGKAQEERDEAIRAFKVPLDHPGHADVLICTDIAAKGLDFPDIVHVINFDMPPAVENYIHRIGRTGRCGKTGIATTFVNHMQSESILLDLKHILREAKQRIPPFLAKLSDDATLEINGVKGCTYCGGLGHRIKDCPKLQEETQTKMAPKKEVVTGGNW